MTTPEIFRDDESGDLDVFVSPDVTCALLEFLRGKIPFFGVTIETGEADDAEDPSEEEEEEEEAVDEEETEEEAGPFDAFSFPSEVDEVELGALLAEFFADR